MGRSPASSCLRIIACSSGDDATEPTAFTENKSSGDKRGWSFRKKPGKQQRGLITNVVSETTPPSRTRETLESALLKSPSPDNTNVSEKQSFDDKKTHVTYVVDEKKTQCLEDKSELEEKVDHRTETPVLVESKGTETEEDDDLVGNESQVKSQGGVIAAIEKDVTPELEIASKVELDESETDDVVIIRKESDEEEEVEEKLDESVIIVIQSAIRGFLARRELTRRKKVVKLQAAFRGHLVRSQAMGSLRCVQAIVKMQTLVRARHSSKDGSRVSEVTNASAQKLLENKFAKHLMESTPKTKPISIKCDPTKPSSSWNWLERWMSVSKPEKTSKADLATEEQQVEEAQNIQVSSEADLVNSDPTLETETETGFSTYGASKVEEAHHVELSETQKMSQYDSPEASTEVYHDSIQSHPLAAKDPDSLLEESEYVDEEPKPSLKRKASNPSFIAAQSKFEELTSYPNKATTLSSKDGVLGEEGKKNIDFSEADITNTKRDHSVEDVAQAELGGSECGTELSVTSSLDTLDKKSDAESAEPKVESKLIENDTLKADQAELIEIDVKDETPLSTVEDLKEKVENVKDDVEISVMTQHDSVISTPVSKKRQAEDELGPQSYQLSHEDSTPMKITESQATPSSQASSSVKARKGKSEKSGSSQKRKVSKKITSSPKQEAGTGEANTTEQEEGKEQKSGRRKSFGFDQEARESSGGKNSLPRFMQPTQSAKAKVLEHNSPRSSPDLQEREVSTKKRLSLPVAAIGKQGSPRIQRSASQAQQGTKDRKWQR